MITREELLREDLARAHRLKFRSDSLRRESELLLTGTRSVLEAASSDDMFQHMFEVLSNIIPYEISFVLDQYEPGKMVCTSSTADELLNTIWDVDPVFKRTVLGQPCVVYDVARQPAWGTHLADASRNIVSALYCPFSGPDLNAILVFCHSHKGFYIQSHAQIAERYKLFMEQLILSINAKLQALETQNLKKQKEQAEYGLMQSEKMASLGLLAAGVAHEINNPISFVSSNMNYIANCLQDLEQLNQNFKILMSGRAGVHFISNDQISEIQEWKEDARIDETLCDLADIVADCKDGLKRVQDIVSNLRSFVRTEDESISLNVNDCIVSTLKLVSNELKYHCDVKVDLGVVAPVKGNSGKLNQVITNLLINAGQAIDGNGEIVISSGLECHVLFGDGVWFSVADNGSGIPKDKISRIFEPFYTTKVVGEGTGLGLSISYSIVEKMGGVIEVESQINKGTCFKVWLPVNR